jgi:segregation and condensation protein A
VADRLPDAPAATDDFARPAPRAAADERFVVDLDGFEGPLDLLLALARSQKVDLARISILALAEQYLAYMAAARAHRLELAADYLVMAAWLAYLKSRLLLPVPPADDEPSAEEMAADLAERLARLERIRRLAALLGARDRLGRDVFARGAPEDLGPVTAPRWSAGLYDLLDAYAAHRRRRAPAAMVVARRRIWGLAEARAVLERLVGGLADWTAVETLLAEFLTPADRASVVAASFSASLELAREGRIELAQAGAFQPIYLRRPPEIALTDAALDERAREGGVGHG